MDSRCYVDKTFKMQAFIPTEKLVLRTAKMRWQGHRCLLLLQHFVFINSKPFIWLRLRANLALRQFWLLPVFSSWLCQFGRSKKVVKCQIGCLELYSAQTFNDYGLV